MLFSLDEIRSLLTLANLLDRNSLYKEADALDEAVSVIIKSANITPPKRIDLNSLAVQNGLKPVSYAGGVAYMLPSPRGKSDRYIGLWVGLSGGVGLGRGGNFKYVVQKAGGQPKIVNESRGFSFFGISQSEKKLLDQWLQHLTKEFKANPGAIPAAPPPPASPPVPPADTNSNPPPEDDEFYDEEEYSDDEITGYEERPAAQPRQPASTTPESEPLIPGDYELHQARSHNLGIEGAKEIVNEMIQDLDSQMTRLQKIAVGGFEGSWSGNTINVTSPIYGIGVVSEDRFEFATNFKASKNQRLVDSNKEEIIQKLEPTLDKYFPE